MKILHVVSGLQKASGVTTFVENVVSELRALGHEVNVLTKQDDLSNTLHFTLSLLRSYDIVHVHGLWDPWLLKIAGKVPRGRLVWSTHGMTAPWSLKHKWWKKCLIWWLWQKPLLKRAALIHSTVEKEREWNRALGLGLVGSGQCVVGSGEVVAPLGTNLPEGEVDKVGGISPDRRESRSERYAGCGEWRTLLFVGRVYPVKAIDRLIEAFAKAKVDGWKLRIVGPDQAGHMAELKKLVVDSGQWLVDRVEFAGPKFGAELEAEYANCDCLALVSHTENFGATVVDAMAHGKPVITSTNTPWKEVEGGPSSPEGYAVASGKAGWWVDNDVETLAATLRSALTTPAATLEAMGKRGRKLVEEKYTWAAVAKKLAEAYVDLWAFD